MHSRGGLKKGGERAGAEAPGGMALDYISLKQVRKAVSGSCFPHTFSPISASRFCYLLSSSTQRNEPAAGTSIMRR